MAASSVFTFPNEHTIRNLLKVVDLFLYRIGLIPVWLRVHDILIVIFPAFRCNLDVIILVLAFFLVVFHHFKGNGFFL